MVFSPSGIEYKDLSGQTGPDPTPWDAFLGSSEPELRIPERSECQSPAGLSKGKAGKKNRDAKPGRRIGERKLLKLLRQSKAGGAE